ncbi:hypothetical protein LCGC14_2878310 [marine sediment metagenome]|uniref:Uncharacterized protein n=1 Tax=marine sediment metagenome TaxID=412755 RepID=A0A0F8Y0U7_9ZZZZ
MLEFEHSKQRALERYDFELSLEDYEFMCSVALKGMILHEDDNGGNPQKTICIRHKDIDFYAVWSDLRETITTFLPPEHFNKSI